MGASKYRKSSGTKTPITKESEGTRRRYYEPLPPIAGMGDSIKELMIKLDGMNPKKP
jgi:hypothetical protein